MPKTKARDILICWPYPKSFSTPLAVASGADWDRTVDRDYHLLQAQMVDAFRCNETKMAALRLNCQLRTQARREQFAGISLVDGVETPVVLTYKGYPHGAAMIKYGLCGIGATHPGGCFFCQFGHMTECHFPLDCKQAACSHLASFVTKIMPNATETIQ